MTPRCPAKACPIRWRDGPDRECSEHRQDRDQYDIAAATAELGIEMDSTKTIWTGEPSQ